MTLLLLSFVAGIITILAPCVFALLPIIIGGSNTNSAKYRPYVITASLALSLLLFSIALKQLSIFANVDPKQLSYFSGGIIIFLGLITVFPEFWDKVSIRLGLSANSDKLLDKAQSNSNGFLSAVFTGAALGPVFSSCSPTYAFVLSTVIKSPTSEGYLNLFAYILGLSLVMLAVSLLGRTVIKKLKWASNPNGAFKKIIGVIFIIVGLLFVTGQDKAFQLSLSKILPFNSANIELGLLEKNKLVAGSSKNIIPADQASLAPEFVGLESWINSDPQTLASLKGKIVLVDFWTYSCINCQRTFPYLSTWYDTYKDKNFVIIGVHAPEFAFEKNRDNVLNATKQFGLKYPVALDNNFKTWDAFKNTSWPAKYLIDANGKIRYQHFGEGDYDTTETAIRALIAESGTDLSTTNTKKVDTNMGLAVSGQTPETYLGWSRGNTFASRKQLAGNENKPHDYTSDTLVTDAWTLNGNWTVNNENIVSNNDTDTLTLQFSAKDIYIVAGSETNKAVQIMVNGKAADSTNAGTSVVNGVMNIQADMLYNPVHFSSFQSNQTLTMTVPKGTRLNVFTFGGI